jgi:Mycothiol maleylpyruvate isomerase N-terminal domain
VRSVPAGAWSSPTPCTDWGALQLTNHVVYEDLWTTPMMAGKTIAGGGGGGHGTTVIRFMP